MSIPTTPDAPRDPRLSETDLRRALDELDAKIRTLHNRTHATAAGSPSTHEAHPVALEAKRARLAEQLNQADSAETSAWDHIRQGIENLRDDIKKVL